MAMLSPYGTTNLITYQNPNHMPGYAGYCPKAKFWHYGDTFGNTTAKCFQDRRSAKLNTSVMNNPGISSDGQHKFPTVYCNLPDLVLSARVRTRERWLNAKKCALFNEHERGREVQEFDKLAQRHRDHYMDRSGTLQRVERFVVPRKRPATNGLEGTNTSKFLSKGVRIKCPVTGKFVSAHDSNTPHYSTLLKMSLPSKCTWRDRALRDVSFEKR